MAKRPCLNQCGRLTTGTRCAQCERGREQARGSSSQRGYGNCHQVKRADYQREMDAGRVFICWRCDAMGKPHAVNPRRWHLGHCDDDRTGYHGPECVAGNTATNGRRSCPHPDHTPIRLTV